MVLWGQQVQTELMDYQGQMELQVQTEQRVRQGRRDQ